MSKIGSFIFGAIDEVTHKVVWPSYASLQESSVLVLAVCFVFSVVVGVIDLGLKNLVSWFYSAF